MLMSIDKLHSPGGLKLVKITPAHYIYSLLQQRQPPSFIDLLINAYDESTEPPFDNFKDFLIQAF